MTMSPGASSQCRTNFLTVAEPAIVRSNAICLLVTAFYRLDFGDEVGVFGSGVVVPAYDDWALCRAGLGLNPGCTRIFVEDLDEFVALDFCISGCILIVFSS
jgi:hypothetical protein